MKAKFLILVFFLLANSAFAQKKVWLDTDLLLGLEKNAPREVDDAIALFMVLEHPEKLDLVGISTISEVAYGKQLAQNLMATYYPTLDIPVYEGSNSCKDIGVENDATIALAAALKKEKLTILAIGPATNIATVLKNHPQLKGQIEEIIFCAGRSPGLPFTLGLELNTVSDYNFDRSNEAFKVVFESGVPVVLSGFEAGRSLFLGETDFEFLRNSYSNSSHQETNQWLYKHLVAWSKLNEQIFGINGFVPWDCTSVGYLLYPEFFEMHKNTPMHIVNKKTDATVPAGLPSHKNYLETTKNSKWKATFVSRTKLGFEEKVLEAFKSAVQF